MNQSKDNAPVRSVLQSAPFPCLTKFSLSELETATNGFSDENLIGRGGSVSVYKGVLKDGLVVAIKRWRSSIIFSRDHLYDELNLVSKLQHKNIVKLLDMGTQSYKRWRGQRTEKIKLKGGYSFRSKSTCRMETWRKIWKGSVLIGLTASA
ncbi:G-type lectin S-receptor-like serine/threonine-protein kinase At1g61360 [Panicum virgatum]|uniref:G-type lectin S-receptor-like serine/threonine-protein kinase At1g61360 n=1 Tax=Panicum virgatum TaxID=38727 RepID=UPI0019D61F4B|nr:G-type lectin S-receptor-like serine/threonine-protein kinase At1g61360 [Panicum virgatum]